MHHRAKDLTGLRSHSLTALKYLGSDGRKSIWTVHCDCGTEKAMTAVEFLKGREKSCGCQRYARMHRTHGMSRHPAYAVWRSMRDRCQLPTHQAWKNYGRRGITVCPEWDASFKAFWRDMGPTYQSGLTIERVDNNAGYSAANCIWATYKTQARNTRRSRRIATPWGEMTVTEASERSGIGVTTLLYRIDHDGNPYSIFSTPDTTTDLSSRA